MILSVGLIVKNEEKYLRRCLDGLKPILNALDAELIITDTGSTDGTLEIAREFTDKIYH
ncbi:MAG: glycosyltransferase, partial [Oscillospiraceae bacterium]|nr:glycosyltransferase [Oscillospiraceae bacterium]